MTQNPHSFIDNAQLAIDVLADPKWLGELPHVEALVRECVTETLLHTCAGLIKNHEVEVTVSLSDDARVKELNAEYRAKDKPTNVLSFANYQGLNWPSTTSFSDDMPILMGDIILAYGVVTKEAIEQNKKFEAHLSHLIVHGCLHLLGYDHLTDEDAATMEDLETKILFGLGIKNPYHVEIE